MTVQTPLSPGKSCENRRFRLYFRQFSPTFHGRDMVQVNQTAASFSNLATFAPQQTQQAQQTVQDEENQIERGTANTAAGSPSDTATLPAAQPDTVPDAVVEENQAVAIEIREAEDSRATRAAAEDEADTGRQEEREEERGSRVDISV